MRFSMMAECKNNPGKLRDTPNCVDVRAASKQVLWDEMESALRKDRP